jgi:hypothetical protein
VFVLAASIFCLGTTEFMIAGLLPTIAGDLGVSIPSAGLLISGFAIGMAVGTPLMTAATLRLPRRATLLASLLVFVLGARAGRSRHDLRRAHDRTDTHGGGMRHLLGRGRRGLRRARACRCAGEGAGGPPGRPDGLQRRGCAARRLGRAATRLAAAFWVIAVLALVSAVGVAMVVPVAGGEPGRAGARHGRDGGPREKRARRAAEIIVPCPTLT